MARLCKLRGWRTQVENLRHGAAFTIVEVLVVMAIILVLAGLILGTSSYVHNKGARSRAEAEIAAMSAALESYKADNGVYPRDAQTTDKLNARATPAPSPASYEGASLFLYKQLSGNDANQQPTGAPSYFNFKAQMLGGVSSTSNTVTFIKDPFGNSYGYSTAFQSDPSTGFNPTFDLWSTANDLSGDSGKWIKNW